MCPPEYPSHASLCPSGNGHYTISMYGNDLDEINDFNEVVLDLDPRSDIGVLALGPPGTVECGKHRIDKVRW